MSIVLAILQALSATGTLKNYLWRDFILVLLNMYLTITTQSCAVCTI